MDNKKILIVDDDLISLKLYESKLKSNDYDVSLAQDGLEALVKIKKDSPDLVVLDVMMPEVNGYDVCRQLRFNPDFERIPIILATERERELPAAIAAFSNIEHIQKPVDLNVLLAAIEKYLK